MGNQVSQRTDDKNSGLQDDDPMKAFSDTAGAYPQELNGLNARALNMPRDRNDGQQIFQRIQRNLHQHENLQEANQNESTNSR